MLTITQLADKMKNNSIEKRGTVLIPLLMTYRSKRQFRNNIGSVTEKQAMGTWGKIGIGLGAAALTALTAGVALPAIAGALGTGAAAAGTGAAAAEGGALAAGAGTAAAEGGALAAGAEGAAGAATTAAEGAGLGSKAISLGKEIGKGMAINTASNALTPQPKSQPQQQVNEDQGPGPVSMSKNSATAPEPPPAVQATPKTGWGDAAKQVGMGIGVNLVASQFMPKPKPQREPIHVNESQPIGGSNMGEYTYALHKDAGIWDTINSKSHYLWVPMGALGAYSGIKDMIHGASSIFGDKSKGHVSRGLGAMAGGALNAGMGAIPAASQLSAFEFAKKSPNIMRLANRAQKLTELPADIGGMTAERFTGSQRAGEVTKKVMNSMPGQVGTYMAAGMLSDKLIRPDREARMIQQAQETQ